MEHNVYMHTVNNRNFVSRRDIENLQYILHVGYLYSRRKQGYKSSSTFSGLDYISLSDFTKKDQTNDGLLYYNAFYSYTRLGIAVSFPKEIIDKNYEVIIPELLSGVKQEGVIEYNMASLGNGVTRYSDLPDEVQIKDQVAMKDALYVTYPCTEFLETQFLTRKENKAKKLIHEINELKKVIQSQNYNLDVYDIDSEILLNEEGIEKVLRLNSIDKIRYK